MTIDLAIPILAIICAMMNIPLYLELYELRKRIKELENE